MTSLSWKSCKTSNNSAKILLAFRLFLFSAVHSPLRRTIVSVENLTPARCHFSYSERNWLEMAVFGFHLTLSVLGVFLLRKLVPVFELPSKFLKGFYRFYAPSEKDCREAANKPEKKLIKDKKNKNAAAQKPFVIPKVRE